MADITMCSGLGCDLKHECYRHTAVQSDWQSWFTEVPLKDGNCEMFWGEKAEYFYSEILKTVKGDSSD